MQNKPTYEELEQQLIELKRKFAERKKSDKGLNERQEPFRPAMETDDESIRGERDFMERMMETSPSGIVRIDKKGTIVYANKRAEEIHGLRLKESGKRSYNDPEWKISDYHGNPFPQENLPFSIVRRTGKPVNNVRHAIGWPDGRMVLLSINAAPLFNSNGSFDGMVASIDDVTESVRKEQRFQMLFREMIDGFALHEIICDETGHPVDYRFLALNPAFERMTGLKADDLVGKRVLEVLPQTEPYWIETFGKVALTGETASFENYSQELDRYFQVTAFRPAKHHFACIFLDITERKRSEKERQKLRAQLSNAMEMARLGHWEYSFEDDLFTFNDQFYNIFRTTAAEVGGYKMSSAEYADRFVHPEDTHMVGEEIEKSRNTTDPNINRQMEHRIIYADGKEGYIQVRFFFIKNTDGNIIGTYGVNQDITERKIAEEALRKSEEKHRSMLETAMDGFLLADGKGKLLEVNKTYCQMSGYGEDELLDMSVSDLDATEDKEKLKNDLKRLGKKGEARFETRHRRKDGSIFDVEASVQRRKEGKQTRYLIFSKDISEKKQMEVRLQQAQKMESIGNLAGGIAHDFNNILFPITGLSEILLEDLPEGSIQHENVLEILKAGKRGSDLVGQILAFSRQSEHKMIPIRVQKVVNEVLRLIRSTIPSNIEITHDIQKDCGLVMADPSQLHQITMNLITNAFHAVEEKSGDISVQLRETIIDDSKAMETTLKPGKYALLSISDTGHGIAPDILNRIFDPYFTTKQQGKGTGLGLAVVYGIVKEHQGDIRVDSQVDRGTTFQVYLPMMETSSEAMPTMKETKYTRGDERILLVDDEAPVANLEKEMLTRLGYCVTSYTGSRDALAAFMDSPYDFDIVITDLTMPYLTGEQLARSVMAVRPELPVIICTGFSEKISREKAAQIGIKAFLMKPVLRSILAETVRNVLDNHQREANDIR